MNSCLLFRPQLCWWMRCCALSLCLCPDVLDQFEMASRQRLTRDCAGWQMVVWSYRGWACVDTGTGLDGSCSRASCGGGPVSRLRQDTVGKMRETMCWDWQSISPPTIAITTLLLLTSPFQSFYLSYTSQPLTKHFPPSILSILLSASSRILPPYHFSLSGLYYHKVTPSAQRACCCSKSAARNKTHLVFKIVKTLKETDKGE